MADYMEIRNPKTLGADRLPVERTPLGRPGDYKPCVAKLPDGTLLVVAFNSAKKVDGRPQEDMLLWRSQDGGRTWSERTITPLLGREPYFSVLPDGTLFISVHLLGKDIRNEKGYVYSMLHRSVDVTATPETAWGWLETGWDLVPEAREDRVTWSYEPMNPWHIAFTPGIRPLRVEIGGEVVLQDGRPTRVDPAEVRAKAREQAARLHARL